MQATTSYFTDEDGNIRVRNLRGYFFIFQSKTEIKANEKIVFVVRTRRKMAKGLRDYFLINKDFQAKVLQENQKKCR